mmetsp:Transcript_31555/g.70989  ORF Transcript_31555/g.70989 Transcript_31555/m.70989 type:complete len:228 (+) Transcript_31555:26-709(+)
MGAPGLLWLAFLAAARRDPEPGQSLATSGQGDDVFLQRTADEPASCRQEALPMLGKKEACFCTLAGHGGCGEICPCEQGCSENLVTRSRWTATFQNLRDASGCLNQTSSAFLTVPRTYIRNLTALVSLCADETASWLIQDSLVQSFQHFRGFSAGAALQCFHAPAVQTVQWLHLHTFCSNGHIDSMPVPGYGLEDARQAWCGLMSAEAQAAVLAERLLEWVRRPSKG